MVSELIHGRSCPLCENADDHQGAHGVFAVTNFWDPEIYPNNIPEEERQGRLLADTAVAAGVKHYIWRCDPHAAAQCVPC